MSPAHKATLYKGLVSSHLSHLIPTCDTMYRVVYVGSVTDCTQLILCHLASLHMRYALIRNRSLLNIKLTFKHWIGHLNERSNVSTFPIEMAMYWVRSIILICIVKSVSYLHVHTWDYKLGECWGERKQAACILPTYERMMYQMLSIREITTVVGSLMMIKEVSQG